MLEQLIAEAQAAGKLRADEDPAQLVFELDSYILRGNTLFVLNDDPSYLRRAHTAVPRRLEQAA